MLRTKDCRRTKEADSAISDDNKEIAKSEIASRR